MRSEKNIDGKVVAFLCMLALSLCRTQTFSISPVLFFFFYRSLLHSSYDAIEWGLVCEHMLPDCANPNGRDVIFVHFVFGEIFKIWNIMSVAATSPSNPPHHHSELAGSSSLSLSLSFIFFPLCGSSFLLTRIYIRTIRIEFTSRTHKPHTNTYHMERPINYA